LMLAAMLGAMSATDSPTACQTLSVRLSRGPEDGGVGMSTPLDAIVVWSYFGASVMNMKDPTFRVTHISSGQRWA
jgi:hypothetical protein